MDVGSDIEDLERFLTMMPEPMKAQFEQYTENQTMVVFILVYTFAPMFLILPMMTASSIAAGSFAGEKERKTMEALLYTPTTDLELMTGKMLSAWIPAILVTLVGFVLYSVVVNVSAWQTMGRIFFPNAMWVVLILWLAPAAAGLGLGTMVLVSSKVSTYQDAYQLGSMVVLPVILLVLGQVGGVIYLNVTFVLAAGLLLWIVDAIVLWFAVKTFRRTEIIARL
jgi:ABC-type Na+ efflux pump permease subunit